MTGTSDNELVQGLADPDNVQKFVNVATVEALGFSLTEDGEWVRLDT